MGLKQKSFPRTMGRLEMIEGDKAATPINAAKNSNHPQRAKRLSIL